mmetsp:Transcript_3936/g.8682  ORF Transcript_3936/g.8682 Transcript_3936/m.8682 type:complete len:190 (+) Transcript_3936:145-714(+)
MSERAKSTHASDTPVTLCPTCHQPRIIPKDGDASSSSDPQSKRQRVASKKPIPSAKRKLRSADNIPTGKFKRKWDSIPNYPVMVRIYTSPGERKWVPGVVDKVIDYYDGLYNIVVLVKDENGKWGIPATIHPTNQDPIPNKIPNDPTFDLSQYIYSRDELLEELSDVEYKHLRCLRYHSGECFDAKKYS